MCGVGVGVVGGVCSSEHTIYRTVVYYYSSYHRMGTKASSSNTFFLC